MDADRKTSIVPFSAELLPLVRRFSESYWKRPTEDAYFDWRYLQPRPFSRMMVALRGDDECVGTLFALRKAYRVRGELVPCLEVFDWHAHPDVRSAGVGIRLMRAMMKQPERIFSVGGTGDVHATLPLMGWQEVTTALSYELVTAPELLVSRLHRLRGIPTPLTRAALALVPRTAFGPRRGPTPAGGEVREVADPGPEVVALYSGETGHDWVQQPDLDVMRWIVRGRWSGQWKFLHFLIDGRLRGWAMTRLNVGGHGLQGVLVEVFAPRADVELYRWMVGEASAMLFRERPRRIATRACALALQQALLECGFRNAGIDSPVRSWPKFGDDAPKSPHFTYLHSDGPLLPYVTEH